MDNLHELTRKLVDRGCPEHPRLYWFSGEVGYPRKGKRNKIECWAIGYDQDAQCPEGVEDDDARDLWTMHALRWANANVIKQDLGLWFVENNGDKCKNGLAATLLEAIEFATRHLATDKN